MAHIYTGTLVCILLCTPLSMHFPHAHTLRSNSINLTGGSRHAPAEMLVQAVGHAGARLRARKQGRESAWQAMAHGLQFSEQCQG